MRVSLKFFSGLRIYGPQTTGEWSLSSIIIARTGQEEEEEAVTQFIKPPGERDVKGQERRRGWSGGLHPPLMNFNGTNSFIKCTGREAVQEGQHQKVDTAVTQSESVNPEHYIIRPFFVTM